MFLWVEAFMNAIFLINRTSTSTLSMESPFSILYVLQPDYNTIRVYGCRCFPYLKGNNKNKFQPKTFSCVFIGYSLLHKGYRCYLRIRRFLFQDMLCLMNFLYLTCNLSAESSSLHINTFQESLQTKRIFHLVPRTSWAMITCSLWICTLESRCCSLLYSSTTQWSTSTISWRIISSTTTAWTSRTCSIHSTASRHHQAQPTRTHLHLQIHHLSIPPVYRYSIVCGSAISTMYHN